VLWILWDFGDRVEGRMRSGAAVGGVVVWLWLWLWLVWIEWHLGLWCACERVTLGTLVVGWTDVG
jgi:hypothetical protein